MKKIRKKSWKKLEKIGLLVNLNLPLFDLTTLMRSEEDIINRLLCLNAVVSSSYGLSKDKAIAWLEQENLKPFLLENETNFLYSSMNEVDIFKTQIEGMWTLSWCLGLISNKLVIENKCTNSFVSILPDLKVFASSNNFKKQAELRSTNKILPIIDYYYCAHWSITAMRYEGMLIPKKIAPYIVIGRRMALEWLFTNDDWYDISLDT